MQGSSLGWTSETIGAMTLIRTFVLLNPQNTTDHWKKKRFVIKAHFLIENFAPAVLGIQNKRTF